MITDEEFRARGGVDFRDHPDVKLRRMGVIPRVVGTGEYQPRAGHEIEKLGGTGWKQCSKCGRWGRRGKGDFNHNNFVSYQSNHRCDECKKPNR